MSENLQKTNGKSYNGRMLVLKPTKSTHLHYEIEAKSSDIIEVGLDADANVMLLDDSNYVNYAKGIHFEYSGGFAQASPVHIGIPYDGRWHLVIDLGGRSGVVHPKVNIIEGLDAAEDR